MNKIVLARGEKVLIVDGNNDETRMVIENLGGVIVNRMDVEGRECCSGEAKRF